VTEHITDICSKRVTTDEERVLQWVEQRSGC